MPISDNFYFYPQSDALNYSVNPIGNLNIERMLQNKQAYWQAPIAKREKNQRTLLLADCLAQAWSEEKSFKIKNKLKLLLDEGFNIYLWQLDKYVSLTLNNIELITKPETRKKIKYNPKLDLTNIAIKQLSKSKDELLILDYFEMEKLITDKEDKQLIKKLDNKIFDTSSEGVFSSSDTLLMKYLISIKNKVINYGFPQDYYQEYFFDHYNELNIEASNKYKKAIFHKDELNKLLNTGSLTVDNSTIKIKDLALLNAIESQGLNVNLNFLHHTLHLNNLDLSNGIILPDNSKTNNLSFNLNKLKTLNLFKCKIDINNVNNFLAAAPNLECLYLTLNKGLDYANAIRQKIDKLNLPKLKYLNVSNSKITNEQLDVLLDGATKLQRLDFSNCKYLDLLRKHNLPLLEELSIGEFVSSYTLNSLLNKTNHLKKLTIIDSKIHLRTIINNINILEELTIKRALNQIDLSSCATTFSKATKIKNLTIANSNFNNLKGLNDLAGFNLINLNELNLSYTNINLNGLNLLTSNSTNLKSLELKGCHNLNDDEFDFGKLKFNNLEYINLSSSQISVVNLTFLIMYCNDLKNLNLTDTGITSSSFPKWILPYIKDINITYSVNPRAYQSNNEVKDEKPQVPANQPTFNLKNHFKATPPIPISNSNEKFNIKDKSLNQTMIIKKLNRYFKLKNDARSKDIEKINQGICLSLSDLFHEMTTNQWQHLIRQISTWNGTHQTLTSSLSDNYEVIWYYVQKHYLSPSENIQFYNCGDNLDKIINKLKNNQSLILSNPWHAISVRYLNANNYIVYDPNYTGGFKKINKSSLIKVIKNSLGHVFKIANKDFAPEKIILNDAHNFIKNGGLLSITSTTNGNQVVNSIKNINFTTNELASGLTLVSTSNRPAWLYGLIKNSNTINRFTAKIICDYYKQAGTKIFTRKLKSSLNLLSNIEKTLILKTLNKQQLFSNNKMVSTLKQIINNAKIDNGLICAPLVSPDTSISLKKSKQANSNLSFTNNTSNLEVKSDSFSQPYNALINKIKENKQRSHLFLKKLLKSTAKNNLITNVPTLNKALKNSASKTLIEASNQTNSVKNLNVQIQKYYAKNHQPLFYIDSVDDLMCSAPFSTIDKTNNVICHKGPGGALYNFLTANHQNKTPVLLINYNEFSADDVVKFNSMLDDIRKCDGTNIPDSFKIIGVINPKKVGVYQGYDFYSRFDKIKNVTNLNIVNQAPLIKPFIQNDGYQYDQYGAEIKNNGTQDHVNLIRSIKPTLTIDLFESPNWQTILLGQTCIDGNKITFKPGSLIKALQKLKQPLTIILKNAPWKNDKFQTFWQQALLNKSFSYLGKTYNLPKDLSFAHSKGYNWQQLTAPINQYTKQSTNNAAILNRQTLHKFFSQYILNGTQLKTMDGFINKDISSLDINVTDNLELCQWAKLLDFSTKNNVTLNLFFSKNTIFPNVIKNNVKLSNTKVNLSLKALQKSHTKIFNCDDVDAAALLLQEQKDYNNALILDVSECNISQLTQRIDSNFKEAALSLTFKTKDGLLKKVLASDRTVILTGTINYELAKNLEPYLQSRLNSQKAPGQLVILNNNKNKTLMTFHQEDLNTLKFKTKLYPAVNSSQALVKIKAQLNSNAPWQGLRAINSNYSNSFRQQLDYANATQLSQQQTSKRLKSVNTLLFIKKSPFVFLAGITGVGKSTFVEKNYTDKKHINFYKGEESLTNWANDKSHKPKILFIDEANIGHRNWSEFESLFNTPAGVRINDKYIELSEHHKVIFAGNPLSYGGGRKMPTLFARHGNSVLFEPLVPAFIYQKIIKKVFSDLNNKDVLQNIATPLLELYKFCSLHSQQQNLISPREIEFIANCIKHNLSANGVNATNLTNKFIYQIGRTLIPAEIEHEFNQKFKTKIDYQAVQLPDFNVTPSRLPALNLLQDFLNFNQQGINPGLGGIIFEGQPGIGKTQMIMSQLKALGFQDATKNIPANNKSYYYIPVSMQTKDKKELLLKAFDEGAIVIVDEINSAPMMERLLNDLLMGVHPQGKKPARDGFMLLATQNPISMAGRRSMSQALARRLLKINLPEYSTMEMKQIITSRPYNMSDNNADVLINSYVEAKQIQPKLTFRAVLNIAKTPIAQHSTIETLTSLATSNAQLKINKLLEAPQEPKINFKNYHIDEAQVLNHFKQKHLAKRNGLFKFFNRTGINFDTMSLEDIILYAQGNNADAGYSGYRSFQILKELGILDDNKQLLDQNNPLDYKFD